MLTADQIKEFERRAAAGEKPQHPGWQERLMIPGEWRCCLWPAGFSEILRVEKEDGTFRIVGAGSYQSEFTSLPAAQLAAEALLMEATRLLWAERIAALESRIATVDAALLRIIGKTSDQLITLIEQSASPTVAKVDPK